jgi:hypothetical protein
MAVCNQSTEDVNETVERTAMARVLDLRNVLELVDDGLDNRALARHQLVGFEHQGIFHITAGLGEELDAIVFKQLLNLSF